MKLYIISKQFLVLGFLIFFVFNCSNKKKKDDILSLVTILQTQTNDSDDKAKIGKVTYQMFQTAPVCLRVVRRYSNVNGYFLVLHWNKIKDKEQKEISEYEVSIDGVNWKKSYYTDGHIFSKLKWDKKYSFQVRTKGQKRFVAKTSVTYGDELPTKPQNLKITQIGRSLISLSWNKSKDFNKDPISYEVSKNGMDWTDVGTKTSYTFSQLLSNTTYNLQVRSITDKSDGESAVIIATTTKMFVTVDASFTSIGLNLSKMIGGKDYEVWINSSPKWKNISNKMTHTFKDLEVNQKFIVKIRIKDKKGNIIATKEITKITNPWEELPLSWKNLIANNVDSIPNNIEKGRGPLPTSLTTDQTEDMMNLSVIAYNCSSDKSLPRKLCYKERLKERGRLLKIKDLSPIKYFKKLKIIDLNGNMIENIPIEIHVLRDLEGLYLSDNYISNISTEIQFLTNLEILNLSSNQFLNFPTEIVSLTSLKYLTLTHLGLKNIPTEIESLINLQHLNLQVNNLTGIPTEIGSLINLQNLYLNNNNLTNIPTEIGSLTNLQDLYLHNNNLISVPTEIGSLINLQKLYLSDNNLTSVPTEIGSLTNLQDLYLHNNNLISVPTEIGSLINLQKLYLDNNNLTSVPTEIGSLISLQELSLVKNQITNILPSIFTNLDKLTDLHLSAQTTDGTTHYTWTSTQINNIQAEVIKGAEIKIEGEKIYGTRELLFFDPSSRFLVEAM